MRARSALTAVLAATALVAAVLGSGAEGEGPALPFERAEFYVPANPRATISSAIFGTWVGDDHVGAVLGTWAELIWRWENKELFVEKSAVDHVRAWAAGEDGVFSFMWQARQAAGEALNETIGCLVGTEESGSGKVAYLPAERIEVVMDEFEHWITIKCFLPPAFAALPPPHPFVLALRDPLGSFALSSSVLFKPNLAVAAATAAAAADAAQAHAAATAAAEKAGATQWESAKKKAARAARVAAAAAAADASAVAAEKAAAAAAAARAEGRLCGGDDGAFVQATAELGFEEYHGVKAEMAATHPAVRGGAVFAAAMCSSPFVAALSGAPDQREVWEWIEYYLAQGVEHFYLYDVDMWGSASGGVLNASVVSPSDQALLRSYVADGIVTIVAWSAWKDAGLVHRTLHFQELAHAHCLHKYGPTARWLGFIDVDEYMVIDPDAPANGHHFATIAELLAWTDATYPHVGEVSATQMLLGDCVPRSVLPNAPSSPPAYLARPLAISRCTTGALVIRTRQISGKFFLRPDRVLTLGVHRALSFRPYPSPVYNDRAYTLAPTARPGDALPPPASLIPVPSANFDPQLVAFYDPPAVQARNAAVAATMAAIAARPLPPSPDLGPPLDPADLPIEAFRLQLDEDVSCYYHIRSILRNGRMGHKLNSTMTALRPWVDPILSALSSRLAAALARATTPAHDDL